MRIFHIVTLLDGGTTVFQIERDGKIKNVRMNVRLECRKDGEHRQTLNHRQLLINDIPVSKGSPEIAELISDIDEWWPSLPEATKTEVEAHLKRPLKGPSHEPSKMDVEAFIKEIRSGAPITITKHWEEIQEATAVLLVRNYAAGL